MNEGRALTYPQAIAFGARCLTVPRRGNVLCASATVAFSLHDAKVLKPAQWYEALRACAGTEATPDAMAPLPGAEVLVLGGIEVDEPRREAALRCGSVSRAIILKPDPDAPGEPIDAGPEAAVWHAEDNPDGRGGPGDDRRPLIIDVDRPTRPLWLGPTPMQHPVRLSRMGVPDARSGAGWPTDAKLSVLHDAHEAFWARALNPGDPLVLTGLSSDEVNIDLPPYRIAMVSARAPGLKWFAEDVRIHSVTLVPRAGVGAMLWRAGIDLGEDIMGQSITALVAALEDADAPARDPEELAYIAEQRWLRPELTLDDRPLLPPALAATVAPPLVFPPDDDPHALKQSAAQDWGAGGDRRQLQSVRRAVRGQGLRETDEGSRQRIAGPQRPYRDCRLRPPAKQGPAREDGLRRCGASHSPRAGGARRRPRRGGATAAVGAVPDAA